MQSLPRISTLFPVLSFLGMGDAMYLTAHHYFGVPLACGPFSGCETVTSSAYSEIFGIPVALFGVVFYAIVFFGWVLASEYKNPRVLRGLCWWSFLGIGASVYFVTIMGFILHAWCTYCLASAVTSTLLAGISIATLKKLATPQTSDLVR